MRGWLLAVLITGTILILSGCKATEFNPPEYARLKSSPAGEIVLASLKKHGYPEWSREGGLFFNIRTREVRDDELLTYEEVYSCDLVNNRIHSQSSEGGGIIQRVYSDGNYWETYEGKVRQDKDAKARGRQKILSDHFFTVLPFLVAQIPTALTYQGVERIGSSDYFVIEADLEYGENLPLERNFRLYYSCSVHGLEKVFFKAREGVHKGKHLWCEYDNFADVDGVLLPLHRQFSVAEEEEDGKRSRPLRDQWLFEVTLAGSVDKDLFSMRISR